MTNIFLKIIKNFNMHNLMLKLSKKNRKKYRSIKGFKKFFKNFYYNNIKHIFTAPKNKPIMKKIYTSLLFIAFALSVNNSIAQFRLGPVAGLNLSRFKYTIPDEYSALSDNKFRRILAPHIGLIFDYGFSDNIGIESGALASFKGGDLETDVDAFLPGSGGSIHGVEETRLTYLEFPFLLRAGGVAGKMNIHFITGFSAAFGLSGTVKQEISGTITFTDPYSGMTYSENINESDEFDVNFGEHLKMADYSLNIGGGFIHEKGFSFKILYSLGLRNLATEDADEGSFKNDCFVISAGWLFMMSSKKKDEIKGDIK
jgi:outer membrane protein with beta-barrel domain